MIRVGFALPGKDVESRTEGYLDSGCSPGGDACGQGSKLLGCGLPHVKNTACVMQER
jgi:hypothetical protein